MVALIRTLVDSLYTVLGVTTQGETEVGRTSMILRHSQHDFPEKTHALEKLVWV